MGDQLTVFRTLQGAEVQGAEVRGSAVPHHQSFPVGGVVGAEVRMPFCGTGEGAECGRREALVIGIDPGTSGGVALLSAAGDLLEVRDMPVLPSGPGQRDEISAHGLAAIVREWQPARAFVALIGPMPHDGAKQAFGFGFGVSKATILATLAVLEVPVDLIAPAVWKRHARIPTGKDTDPKGAARVEATRRWPARADLFRRVKDHGRAESALIGACGLTRGVGL